MDWKSHRIEAVLEQALIEDQAANDATTSLVIDPRLRAVEEESISLQSQESLLSFHSELAFLVRTFFFVLIGAATRIFCIPIIITMAIAFLFVHAGSPFSGRELAFVYAVPFVAIMLMGPGRLSIDSLFGWFKR